MGITPTALAPEAESHSLNSVCVRLRLIQSFSERTDCAFDPIGVVRQFHLTVDGVVRSGTANEWVGHLVMAGQCGEPLGLSGHAGDSRLSTWLVR
jgi:hypothetical protein